MPRLHRLQMLVKSRERSFHDRNPRLSHFAAMLAQNDARRSPNGNFASSTLRFSSDDADKHHSLCSIKSTIPQMGQGIQVDQYATLERSYSHQDVERFASLVQDFNPIHTVLDWDKVSGRNDESSLSYWSIHQKNGLLQYDAQRKATKPIVHGMLVSSIFSSIFATLSPGCIYLNQSLDFVRPVYVDEVVRGRIDIERIRKWRKGGVVVQCSTRVISADDRKQQNEEQEDALEDVMVKGIANVWLPGGYAA
jgi:acyl dehydratase